MKRASCAGSFIIPFALSTQTGASTGAPVSVAGPRTFRGDPGGLGGLPRGSRGGAPRRAVGLPGPPSPVGCVDERLLKTAWMCLYSPPASLHLGESGREAGWTFRFSAQRVAACSLRQGLCQPGGFGARSPGSWSAVGCRAGAALAPTLPSAHSERCPRWKKGNASSCGHRTGSWGRNGGTVF